MTVKHKKVLQPPFPGAILEANDKTWYNDTREPLIKPVLDHKGNDTDCEAVYLIPKLSGSEDVEDDCNPSNLYICPICYGTGASNLFSPQMHLGMKLEEKRSKEEAVQSFSPMNCTACNGRGVPPIPYGELNE